MDEQEKLETAIDFLATVLDIFHSDSPWSREHYILLDDIGEFLGTQTMRKEKE